MIKLFMNFDNVVANTNECVINIINKRYGLSKKIKDLKDYNYQSIAPITKEEKKEIFESQELFSNLKVKGGFYDVFNKYNNISFVALNKGTPRALDLQSNWINKNISNKIKSLHYDKNKKINMKQGIQISDNVDDLETNAMIKILYKSDNDFKWQQNYNHKDILVVNTWEEIDKILSFYSLYDYRTLDSIK